MSILTDFRAWIVTKTAVTSLLSSAAAVFGAHVDAKVEKPYIVFDLVGDPGHHHLGGVAAVGNPMLQVGCWAVTREAADTLADAVEAEFDGLRGTMGTAWCRGAFKRDRRGPLASDPYDGTEDRFYEVQLDFEVWHA